MRDFIKTDELIRLCCDDLIPQISGHNISGVIGIPRSGIMLASVISNLLHIPLYSVAESGLILLSGMSKWGGGRMVDFKEREGKFLVIDDTVWHGAEMKRIKGILKKKHPEKSFIFSAIYVPEDEMRHVDFYSKAFERSEVPYLEWNFMSNVNIQETILDLDGLICNDAPLPILKNHHEYTEFINKDVPTSYVPRRLPCHCILTGRSEKYREVTERWLLKNRVLYKELHMHPRTTGEILSLSELCEYKSNFFSSSDAKLLVESHCGIAECVNGKTGKPTLCLPEGKIFDIKYSKKKCHEEEPVAMNREEHPNREHFLENGLPECQCESAGYCPIFKKTFGPTLHSMCQNNQAFRNSYLGMVKDREADPIRQERLKEIEERNSQAVAFDRAIEELKDEGISLKEVRESSSEGLGDTIEKALSKFGITKKLMENVAGIGGCRCDERKKWLNRIFPYGKKKKGK